MRLLTTALIAFLLLIPRAYADVVDATVIGVTDGHTLTVRAGAHLQYKVRLAGIVAPEIGQSFGDRSRQSLSDAVMGKPVTVDWHKLDRWGQAVGKVLVAEPGCENACLRVADVGLAQVAAGLARHFKQYQHEQSPEDRAAYAQSEDSARKAGIGLWSQTDPVAP